MITLEVTEMEFLAMMASLAVCPVLPTTRLELAFLTLTEKVLAVPAPE